MSHQFKMGAILTELVLAVVVDFITLRNRAIKKFPRKDVCVDHAVSFVFL